jgi:hypothetical protein
LEVFNVGDRKQICEMYIACVLKGIGLKLAEKTIKNNLRSNNYEVCTAVALCFPNILDVMVLKNINCLQIEIGRPSLWSNDTGLDFCHQSNIYTLSAVYISTAR